MKKKIIITAAAVIATTALIGAGVVITGYNKLKNADYTLPEGFTITAHTGCEGEEDNSLESILAGARAGADIVEIDLHFLADGTAVLCHDDPEVAAHGEKLVTLESAFEALADLQMKMNVDVKSTANLSEVVRLSEKYGVTEKIFFTGVRENDVQAVKKDAPEIPYYLNVDVDKKRNTDPAYLSGLTQKVKDCGAIGINLNYKGCSKELVEAFRKEGLLVSLWTANSKKAMYRCLGFEPDNITTRKPTELKAVLHK